MIRFDKIKLTRVDNTCCTYDVEENWSATGDWVWTARIVLDIAQATFRVTRGALRETKQAAIRTYGVYRLHSTRELTLQITKDEGEAR